MITFDFSPLRYLDRGEAHDPPDFAVCDTWCDASPVYKCTIAKENDLNKDDKSKNKHKFICLIVSLSCLAGAGVLAIAIILLRARRDEEDTSLSERGERS